MENRVILISCILLRQGCDKEIRTRAALTDEGHNHTTGSRDRARDSRSPPQKFYVGLAETTLESCFRDCSGWDADGWLDWPRCGYQPLPTRVWYSSRGGCGTAVAPPHWRQCPGGEQFRCTTGRPSRTCGERAGCAPADFASAI